MVSSHFHQCQSAGIKPSPNTAHFVAQNAPKQSSKGTSGIGNHKEYSKLSSALRQTLEEHIGTNFRDFAFIALCDQGAAVLPSNLEGQQSHLLHALWDYLKTSIGVQALRDTISDQKNEVSSQTLQELSDLLYLENGHQCNAKVDTNMCSSHHHKLAVKTSPIPYTEAQESCGEASKNRSAVSEPLTATDVIVSGMRDFEISDTHELSKFYNDFLSRLSIHYLKTLVKVWVNHFYGSKKQRNFRQKEFKPVWWPEKVACVSPNSLIKKDLVALASAILRHRHDSPEKDVESLTRSAKEILLVRDFWAKDLRTKDFDEKIITEVLKVAKIHENYGKREIDSNTMVYVDALIKSKKIRGPGGRKRSRSNADTDTKALPLRGSTMVTDSGTYVKAVKKIDSSQIYDNSISFAPQTLQGEYEDSSTPTFESGDRYMLNTNQESFNSLTNTTDVSEERYCREKKQIRYCDGSQSPKSSNNCCTAILSPQEAISGSRLDEPPYHAYEKEQCVEYDLDGFLEVAGLDNLTVSIDFETPTVATSSAAEDMIIDLTSDESSNSNSNISTGTNSGDRDNNYNSYWMPGIETNMGQHLSMDGLAYYNFRNSNTSPFLNEMDCLVNDRAPDHNINQFNIGTDNSIAKLRPPVPTTFNPSFPVEHEQDLSTVTHANNNDKNLTNDQFITNYFSKLPLCSAHANYTRQQQQQQLVLLQRQQREVSYQGNDMAALQSGHCMDSFGHHNDINNMSILTPYG